MSILCYSELIFIMYISCPLTEEKGNFFFQIKKSQQFIGYFIKNLNVVFCIKRIINYLKENKLYRIIIHFISYYSVSSDLSAHCAAAKNGCIYIILINDPQKFVQEISLVEGTCPLGI